MISILKHKLKERGYMCVCVYACEYIYRENLERLEQFQPNLKYNLKPYRPPP